ncbi:hypothetical protein GCM10023152_33700 [Agromyces bauzanensis]|uniref:Uncharacterized protein n=1 Tax=Agromyces bauzanensis TaxID=1308924 RepID=A0A917PUZ4_9MICO|nr:hypothetical protein GCM10011372_34050 [Agromyces bauzanensis]
MQPLSPHQLHVLRSIQEHGLVVASVSLEGEFAMAHLGLPAPDYETVRVTTARRLARDGLIARQQYTPPPGEVIIEWEITEAGRRVLRAHELSAAQV